jgi:hypothetical protein
MAKSAPRATSARPVRRNSVRLALIRILLGRVSVYSVLVDINVRLIVEYMTRWKFVDLIITVRQAQASLPLARRLAAQVSTT